jgi:hypothetical protein
MRRWLLAVVLIGCPSNPPPPGDEQMGSFEFRAMRTGGDCPFGEIPADAGFNFSASFSRFRDAGIYFVTIGGVPHEASFDGQRVTATYTAQRTFSQCSGCAGHDAGVPAVVTMTETMIVTLVSRSQSDAVMGCTENPPVDPDAGIVLPGSTPEGTFDAVRACGTLGEHVTIMPPVTTTNANCIAQCDSCTYAFSISGDRR